MIEIETPTTGGHGSQLWWVEVHTAAAKGASTIINYKYVVHAPTAEAAREDTRRYYTEDDRLRLLPIIHISVEPWGRGNILPWAYDIEPG